MATIKREKGSAKCCVLDDRGKTIACFSDERQAVVMQRIVSRSSVRVACRTRRRRARKRRR